MLAVVGVAVVLMLAGGLWLVRSWIDGTTGGSGTGTTHGGESSSGPIEIHSSFNVWLSDGYAEGVGQAWETSSRLVATSADRKRGLFVSTDSTSDAPKSAIHDIADGTLVQALPELDCTFAPAIEGKVYCIGDPKEGVGADGEEGVVQPLVELDVATGEARDFYLAPFAVTSLEAVGVRDGVLYAATQSQLGAYFIAFSLDSQSILWQSQEFPTMARSCQMLPDYIACEEIGRYAVHSIADGALVLEGSTASNDNLHFYFDHLTIGEFFGDERTIIAYADGSEEVTEDFLLSLDVPASSDAIRGDTDIISVDASGNPVVVADVGMISLNYRYAASGKKLPDGVRAHGTIPTTSGTAVLGDESETPVLLTDPEGDTLHSWDQQVKVVDGIVVQEAYSGTAQTTRVFPPAG